MTSNISIINLIKCKIELNDGDNKRLLARVSEKKFRALFITRYEDKQVYGVYEPTYFYSFMLSINELYN